MDGERQEEMQEEKKKRHKSFHPHPPVSGECDHCVHNLPHLPMDVIQNILSRLSVRTLGRFCCVCKQWLSLTRDTRFALEQHARGALARPPSILQTRHQNDPASDRGGPVVVTVHVYDFVERGLLTYHRIYECGTRKCFPPSSNFVHGLTCAMDTDGTNTYLSVLNPTTGEVAKIPTKGRHRRRLTDYSGLHGFGYDATTGEYKVVGIYAPRGGNNYKCDVLTLGGRRTWRHLGTVPYDFIAIPDSSVSPVFLHGAIHWVGYGPTNYVALLTFDVKEEKFGFISSPLRSYVGLRAFELRGHLAVLFWETENGNPNILGIWCLNNYASHEWTLRWRIDCSCCTISRPRRITAVCHAGEDSLLLFNVVDSGVYSYDLRSMNFSKIYDLPYPCSSLDVYSESLLSPRTVSQQFPESGVECS